MMRSRTYGAYGENVISLQGARAAFAGELTERDTGWYLLGSRLYSPVLRRFLDPDPESPWNDGGFNRHVYCSGDPVNRIDPSGNAWTDWLAAGLMVALSVVGTVISGGVLAAPMGAATGSAVGAAMGAGLTTAAGVSAGAAAAVATPGLVAAATATVMDVVSTVAAIGSVASMATHNQKANSIFGWIGMGTGIASGVASVTAAKQIGKAAASMTGTSRGTLTATAPGPRTGSTAAAHATISTVKTAAPLVSSSASARTSPRRSSRSLVTSNANASLPQLKREATGLKANGVAQTSLYVGAHGSRQTFRNPHQARPSGTGKLSREDMEGAKRAGGAAGLRIDTADMTTLTKEQTRRRLSEDGIAVIVNGHGLVDDAVMKSLNMHDTVSDRLLSVHASL